MKKSKWRTVLGLVLLYLAILLNWQWMWGVLLLYWVIPDCSSGVTYFLEPISRRENPLLYWLIVGTWFVCSAYLLSADFIS